MGKYRNHPHHSRLLAVLNVYRADTRKNHGSLAIVAAVNVLLTELRPPVKRTYLEVGLDGSIPCFTIGAVKKITT